MCHLPAPWPNRGADQNVEYLQDRNHPFSLGNVFSEIPVEIPWGQRSGTGMCGQRKQVNIQAISSHPETILKLGQQGSNSLIIRVLALRVCAASSRYI